MKFQNLSGNPQQAEVIIVQQNVNGDASPAQPMTDKAQKGGNYIEDRQNKRNQVLEHFIREAKRKGEMTTEYENKIRENFRIRQEVEDQRLREEEKWKQVMLDKALVKKLQEDKEKPLRQQAELEERERPGSTGARRQKHTTGKGKTDYCRVQENTKQII